MSITIKPKPDNKYYIEKQELRESNARSYPRRIPIAIREASGMIVTDVEGNPYMDCLAGAGSLALGHNHPVVIEAIKKVIDERLPLHTLDLTSPLKDELIELLFSILPPAFSKRAKIQFCGPAGTDAVEAALKLVKTATGKRSILSFHGGYHGMTHGALSLMGNTSPKEAIVGLMPDVHFLPFPYRYRCPFGLGGESTDDVSIHYVRRTLEDPESGIPSPAGMILEIIQGEGGVIPASDKWVKSIRQATKDLAIPFIVDEVQTGFGRTGKMFAFEHANINPDVLILSKALGGSLPLAVMIYDEDLDQWGPGAHAGTFRGNQLAMATGIATIRYILKNNIPKHAEQMGIRMRTQLIKCQQSFACIGEVRGKGLMLGVEIVNSQLISDPIGSFPSHPKLARSIQQYCLQQGLIVELGGRNGSVIRFLPPLNITPEQVDTVVSRFGTALEQACHGGRV